MAEGKQSPSAPSSSSALVSMLNECANKFGPTYVKFDDLKKDVPYKVHKFGTFTGPDFNKVMKTHLTVFIDDGYLVLPERFDSLAGTGLDTENLYIVYHGREKKRLMIEFISI